jgi:hypothetical protein
MLRTPIIHPDQSYTFSDYFKLNFAPQDILAYFGVSLQRRALDLPRYTGELDRLIDLKARTMDRIRSAHSLRSHLHRKHLAIWTIRSNRPRHHPRPQPLPRSRRSRRTHPDFSSHPRTLIQRINLFLDICFSCLSIWYFRLIICS